MKQDFHELRIRTRGRGLYEITDEVAGWISQNRFQNGLVTLHIKHTSASLLIQENADPDVRRDLDSFSRAWSPMATRSSCIPPKVRTTCPPTSAQL